jgi:hypothetical protein
MRFLFPDATCLAVLARSSPDDFVLSAVECTLGKSRGAIVASDSRWTQ